MRLGSGPRRGKSLGGDLDSRSTEKCAEIRLAGDVPYSHVGIAFELQGFSRKQSLPIQSRSLWFIASQCT